VKSFVRFRTLQANRWALRIRRAFDRLYRADPQKAIEHANVLLDQASREEGERVTLILAGQ